ncbi:MAG: hypothetical protein RBS73_14910 [Prolixibacteraceae bacterium]|nr:hypothetical protein [Prolixibacteraceae bacterium]
MEKREVAQMVRNYLPEIDDRLINSIELAENTDNDYSNELVWASIDQKIKELKVFDFSSSIKISHLKLFFFRFLLVFSVFALSFLFLGNEMIDSASRLIHYQSEFIKPSPFKFVLKNESLEVKKGSGLKIEMELHGKIIPELVFVSFGGNNFLMEKKGNLYSYEIENINNSFLFYFSADNYFSEQYRINIVPVPVMGNFEVEVVPPSYTDLKSETFLNVGDLKISHGSLLQWSFKTFETNELTLTFDDSLVYSSDKESDKFVFEKRILKNCKYSVSLKNEHFSEENVLTFQIEVIPDLYPQVEVVQMRDSINFMRYYFKGTINDDYGFSRLVFRLFNEKNDSVIDLSFVKSLDQQDFYFTFDFSDFKEDNELLNYYFSVFDNDVVSGFKETSSESFSIKFLNRQDRRDFENSGFQDLEKLMDKSFRLNDEIRSGLNELRMDQVNSNMTEWEKQQKVNEIVEKRKSLEEILQEINKKNEELKNFKNSFTEEKSDIVEKQKQIEELLKEVLSDELKKLFEEFNKLASDFNSQKLDQLTNDMDMHLDDLSKQLERNLEMLKRMKVVQKVQAIIDELHSISEKEKLYSAQLDSSRDFEKAAEAQKKMQGDYEFQKEEYSQILNFNKELQKPLNLADFQKEFSEIGEEFTENQLMIGKKRKSSSAEGMKTISEKIENLAFSIQQMLDANEKKEAYEDLQNLRQILKNLVYLSHFQERLHGSLKTVQGNDPLINEILTNQLRIIDQTKIVKDSLYSLAKRNPQISGVVNREILNVQSNSEQVLKMLEEAQLYNMLVNQQNAMTSFNNLALFISEIIKKAEEEMANEMPGDQECSKPGKSKKQSIDMLKQSQEAMKQQLQKMIDQMKSGSKEGISRQLGQTLAQQEIMQQLIREMMGSSEVGSSAKEQLKMVDQLLENNKRDIISRNISAETINRQNLILNKLLDAEKAEMERDVDNERESKTAIEKFYSNPDLFFQYKKDVQKGDEQILRYNYQLEQYYDRKYKDYLNKLKE